MTNAFTKQPDTSWIRKLQRDVNAGEISRNRLNNPTEAQRRYMGINAPAPIDPMIKHVPSEDTEGGEI